MKTDQPQPSVSLAADTGGGKSRRLFRLTSRLGRVAAPPVDLPSIEYEAEAIAAWLHARSAPQRRPEQTARVLALAVKLYLDGQQPWPVRRQVSEHTGVSLPMIDVIMSQRQASKDITVWLDTVAGNVKKHESIITRRFIQPSDELIALVQRAMLQRTKDEKIAIRREKRRAADAKRRGSVRSALDLKSLAPPAPNSEMGCEVRDVEGLVALKPETN